MARAKNMQALTNDIRAQFPGVIIWGIGDAVHKLRTSDHNEDDTAGVRAAQSDPDSNPEHRAIDVKIDSAFTRTNAYAVINHILADIRLKSRLRYINFENYQWSRSNGWVRRDNSDDPHPGHVHFSGIASNDEDGSSWFTTIGGENPMGDTEIGRDVWNQEIYSPALNVRDTAGGWLKRVELTRLDISQTLVLAKVIESHTNQLIQRPAGGVDAEALAQALVSQPGFIAALAAAVASRIEMPSTDEIATTVVDKIKQWIREA